MRYIIFFFLFCVLITSCGPNSNNEHLSVNRWICVSKQYNEIFNDLGLCSNLVAVDLSSVFPQQINKIPKVGYHRALSIEPILAFQPSLFIHDHNIGPDQIENRLKQMHIPIKSFNAKGNTLNSTYHLINEMGIYFKCKNHAKRLIQSMKDRIALVLKKSYKFNKRPRVLIIHFGRVKNHFLLVTSKSPAAQLVELAGGKIDLFGEKHMKLLTPELIAECNPDVILLTDYGYDQLKKNDGVMSIPGIAQTNAAHDRAIYRVNEYDVMYFSPRTAEQIEKLQVLIHDKENK